MFLPAVSLHSAGETFALYLSPWLMDSNHRRKMYRCKKDQEYFRGATVSCQLKKRRWQDVHLGTSPLFACWWESVDTVCSLKSNWDFCNQLFFLQTCLSLMSSFGSAVKKKKKKSTNRFSVSFLTRQLVKEAIFCPLNSGNILNVNTISSG